MLASPDKNPAVLLGAEAGQAYEKLADIHIKQESKGEAASACVEAAKCYQKTSKSGECGFFVQGKRSPAELVCATDVLRALHKAVAYFTETGRLSMAAKNLRVHACSA